jgi:serine/threonine-protein kinase
MVPSWPPAGQSGADGATWPDEPDDAPPRATRRRRWPLVVAAVIVSAGAVGAIAGVLLRPAKTYAVPALKGLDPHSAAAHAQPHFTVTVHHVRLTGDPVGVVLDQQPAAGAKHRPTAIVVDVSDGNALVSVPDLSQMTTADAGTSLRKIGLVVTQGTPAFSDTVAGGHVISWSPTTRAAVGDSVTIVVSLGSRYVAMPDLVTSQVPSGQAVQQLVALGIAQSAISQTQDFSDTVPAGDVISTNPPAGQQADRAGTVTLDVSKGPDVVPVPDVRGDSVGSAKAALQQAGLVPYVYGPPGFSVIVDQNPPPGHKVKRGSSVQLVAL